MFQHLHAELSETLMTPDLATLVNREFDCVQSIRNGDSNSLQSHPDACLFSVERYNADNTDPFH